MTTHPNPIYNARQYRLLIAGSREASAVMLQKAAHAVERAKANGWAVLVGDADGVDSAVITVCNKFEVNYLCCGISPKPRATTFLSVQQGGSGRYLRVGSPKAYDYTARDRSMVELADRGLFLWNQASQGTRAGYEYLRSLNKPGDLLKFGQAPVPPPPAQESRPPRPPKPAVIELILDATTGDEYASGTFGLRALDTQGKLLYQARADVPNIPTTTADYAKLSVIIHALDRLKQKLHGEATYTLRIVQSSKNVEGWLGHAWKRNAETVKQLASDADALLKLFPTVEWTKMPRAQVTAALSKIQ